MHTSTYHGPKCGGCGCPLARPGSCSATCDAILSAALPPAPPVAQCGCCGAGTYVNSLGAYVTEAETIYACGPCLAWLATDRPAVEPAGYTFAELLADIAEVLA